MGEKSRSHCPYCRRNCQCQMGTQRPQDLSIFLLLCQHPRNFDALARWRCHCPGLDGNGLPLGIILGTNEVMLSGNLVAILSSGIIHYIYSKFIDPQDYDFAELDKKITLVEDDQRGLSEAEMDPAILEEAEQWIKRRGYLMSFILIIVWPALSVPAGVFSESYFAFWVLIAIAWGFGAALIITILPIMESIDDIKKVMSGLFNCCTGRGGKGLEENAFAENDNVVDC